MELVQAKRIITSVGDEVIEDGAVLVSGGKIIAVGRLSEVKSKADASTTITDLKEMTIVPGLFDSHVHLGFDGGPDPVKTMMDQTDEQQLVLMLRSARELLRAGVTTARDLGARGHLALVVQEAIETEMAAGPELIVANQPITPTGGHCWFMGGEVDSIDDIRKAVRERHKSGATYIKVMSTGGFMTAGSAPWYAQFSLEELTVLVNEASRVSKPVAAHAHGTPGIRNAVQAGVSTIEHCSWVVDQSSFFGPGPGTDGYDPEVAAMMADRGIRVCATINVRFKDFPDDRRASAVNRFQKMRDAGVRFIAGTDSGINLTPHGGYGGGLVAMHQCGFSPSEVLAAATIHAADGLGLGDRKGSIEVGKDADLVAFKDDPLEDVSAYEDCAWVMTRGLTYDFVAAPNQLSTQVLRQQGGDVK